MTTQAEMLQKMCDEASLVDELRAELQSQWESNHAETPGNPKHDLISTIAGIKRKEAEMKLTCTAHTSLDQCIAANDENGQRYARVAQMGTYTYQVTEQQQRCLRGEHEVLILANGADLEIMRRPAFVYVCRHCRCLYVER